jgi:hypothetical protein
MNIGVRSHLLKLKDRLNCHGRQRQKFGWFRQELFTVIKIFRYRPSKWSLPYDREAKGSRQPLLAFRFSLSRSNKIARNSKRENPARVRISPFIAGTVRRTQKCYACMLRHWIHLLCYGETHSPQW